MLVFVKSQEVSKLKAEVYEKTRQLQTIINGLASENMELKTRMKDLEAFKAKVDERDRVQEAKIEELKQSIVRVIKELEKRKQQNNLLRFLLISINGLKCLKRVIC